MGIDWRALCVTAICNIKFNLYEANKGSKMVWFEFEVVAKKAGDRDHLAGVCIEGWGWRMVHLWHKNDHALTRR